MPPGWDATRRRVLARDAWLCRLRFAGCTVHASEVHHARPGDESDEALWSACGPCHRVVTQRQAAAARWPVSAVSPASAPAPPAAAPELGEPSSARAAESGIASPVIRRQVSPETRAAS